MLGLSRTDVEDIGLMESVPFMTCIIRFGKLQNHYQNQPINTSFTSEPVPWKGKLIFNKSLYRDSRQQDRNVIFT